MPEPTLEQVFGAGTTQTATTVTILKSNLSAVGLTASATNKAESLFVALFLKAKQYLNSANQESNVDIQVTLEDSFPSIVFRNNRNYRQFTYNVNLQKVEPTIVIDPDDY